MPIFFYPTNMQMLGFAKQGKRLKQGKFLVRRFLRVSRGFSPWSHRVLCMLRMQKQWQTLTDPDDVRRSNELAKLQSSHQLGDRDWRDVATVLGPKGYR